MSSIFEFEIKLKGLAPPIWRRVQINADNTFEDLHMLLQIVFGYQNYHLFDFNVGDVNIAMPDETGELINRNGDGKIANAFLITLQDVLGKEGQAFSYTYDFGDEWEHEIVLADVLTNEKLIFPNCLKGKRSGPLEDSGGVMGYQHMLEVLEKPSDDHYEEIIDWLGEDFDPEEFDLQVTNEIIIEYFSQKDREN